MRKPTSPGSSVPTKESPRNSRVTQKQAPLQGLSERYSLRYPIDHDGSIEPSLRVHELLPRHIPRGVIAVLQRPGIAELEAGDWIGLCHNQVVGIN